MELNNKVMLHNCSHTRCIKVLLSMDAPPERKHLNQSSSWQRCMVSKKITSKHSRLVICISYKCNRSCELSYHLIQGMSLWRPRRRVQIVSCSGAAELCITTVDRNSKRSIMKRRREFHL